jgi:hypothetical protein
MTDGTPVHSTMMSGRGGIVIGAAEIADEGRLHAALVAVEDMHVEPAL